MILRKNPKSFTTYSIYVNKEYTVLDFVTDIIVSFKNEKGTIYIFNTVPEKSIDYENGTIIDGRGFDDNILISKVHNATCVVSDPDATVNYYITLSPRIIGHDQGRKRND